MTTTPTHLPAGTRAVLRHVSGASYPITVHADWTAGDRKIVVTYDLSAATPAQGGAGGRPWWATGNDIDLAIIPLDGSYSIQAETSP